ncbi:hypothetical protein ACSBR1_030394 [Camellia fascicularis]
MLASLVDLKLSGNSLTSSIPVSIRKLGNLTTLYLYDNQLSGSIPQEIGMLSFLIDLDLSQNNLTGLIPISIGNLGNLTYLNLHDNKLFGSISPLLNNLTHLTKFAIANYNNLAGPISNNLRNCSSLYRVRFEGNQLSGNISEDVGIYPNLVYIDLSHNNFHNPSEFGKLDNNHLLGSIPPEFRKLSNLENLNLASNDLSGSIHGALWKCLKLLNLNLSSNRFGENIPVSLQSLDLSHNLVTGMIPQQIGELRILETLNLSHNKLSGSLPSSFNNMLSLTLVDVSYNQLEGPLPKTVAFRKASFETLKSCCEVVLTGQVVAVKKLHNIVKLYGYCSHSRHSFLVYEFLEGGSLGKILSTEDQSSHANPSPNPPISMLQKNLPIDRMPSAL